MVLLRSSAPPSPPVLQDTRKGPRLVMEAALVEEEEASTSTRQVSLKVGDRMVRGGEGGGAGVRVNTEEAPYTPGLLDRDTVIHRGALSAEAREGGG